MILPQGRRLLPLLLSITSTTAEVLGPLFPPPTDLSSDTSLVKAAWDNLSSIFDAYLTEGRNTSSIADLVGAENVTWSTSLFSLHDPAAADLQYHWTSLEIAAGRNGTQVVDGDSIYRIASVSKLVTAFAGMIELTNEQWNTPLSQLIPGLGNGTDESDPLAAPDWDRITPWALANQLAGVTTFGVPVFDLTGQTYTLSGVTTNKSVVGLETADGFPPALFSSLGPCTDFENLFCEADDFIASVRALHPNLRPWTTPAYSNFGFMMLGLAISNTTKKSYEDLYIRSIFEPLGMTSSSVDAPTGGPDFDRSVIVGPTPETGGFISMGSQITNPSGGLLSTINDLNKLGIGLLNSTLLPSEKTRQWMKPHGHSASLTYSVGAPWEITRYVHPESGRVTDIYAKLGDSGPYGGILAVIPDYNAGFSFLNAATNSERSPVALNIINRIVETIMPALEAQGKAEARKNFVGEYEYPDAGLNSSISITFNDTSIPGPTAPSLSISSWISNGTDMLTQFGNLRPQLQLTIPKQCEGSGPVAFEAFSRPQWPTYMKAGLGPYSGFYESNFGWALVDTSRYAGNNVGLFVFDVDAEGRARSVRTAGTQATLRRVES